jgi:hypothetical protein
VGTGVWIIAHECESSEASERVSARAAVL